MRESSLDADDRKAIEAGSMDKEVPQVVYERQQDIHVTESSGGLIMIVQEVDKAETSTPPATINNLPSPSLFEVGYFISSYIPPIFTLLLH